MKAFIINLERRPDRTEYVHKNYKSDLYELEIFKAFDGKYLENNNEYYNTLKDEFLNSIKCNQNNNQKYKYYFLNEFKKGELGCFMSHILLWKKIIDENINISIILEDDCIFNENFNNKLKEILNNLPQDLNIMYLGGILADNFTSGKDIKINENISIKKNKSIFTTSGYIITKECAKTLYEYAFKIFRGNLGVDYFMHEFLTKNEILIYLSNPLICYSNSNNDKTSIFKTDIQSY